MTPRSPLSNLYQPTDKLVAYTQDFLTAAPFPHLTITGLFKVHSLNSVLMEWPDLDDQRWHTFTGSKEAGKAEGSDSSMWGPKTRQLLDWLCTDPEWLAALTAITGINELVGLTVGGGLHQSGPGAHLDTHVDFTRDPRTGLYRRLNFLVYLNDNWRFDDGGVLVLGADADRTILPTFNTSVLFATSSRSWHGHPTPVATGKLRKSLAVYYYSEDPSPEWDGDHSTRWL